MKEFERAALYIFALLLALAAAATLIEWALVQRLTVIDSNALLHPGWWKHSLRHFALVAGLEAAVLAACLPLRFVERIAKLGDCLSRTFAAGALTLLVTILLLLYAANFLTLNYLHVKLERSIITQTLDVAPQVLAAHPALFTAIGLAILAFGAGTAFLTWCICRRMAVLTDRILGILPELARALRTRELSRRVMGPVLAASAVAGFCLCGFAAWTYVASDVLSEVVRGFLTPPTQPRHLLPITLGHGDHPLVPTSARNIIVILSDSLRADHFPQYGYARMTTPFLAELAKTGHLRKADRTVSTCSETPCGIPGVLLSNTFTRIADHPNTSLQTLLRDAGYEIDFLLSGSHLTNSLLKSAYGDMANFDVFTDGVLSGRGNDDRQVLEALDAMPPAGLKPHFFFFFLMSSHLAGTKFPEYQIYQPQKAVIDAAFRNRQSPGSDPLSAAEHAEVVNSYDNGVRQTDDFIRRIFEKLTAKGYLSDAIVFISSDHAEALGEHGFYAHGNHIYPEFVTIPLFIYDTSDRSYPSIPLASQTDIAATAVASIGLVVPPTWDGIDLAGNEQRRKSFTQNLRPYEKPCRGVHYRPAGELYYLLSCQSGQEEESEEVFDISTDPLGLADIRERINPLILGEMRKDLREAFPNYKNVW